MPLSRFLYVFAVALLLPLMGQGQVSSFRQAEKKISQGHWQEARDIFIKALRKDSLSVQAELAISQWFLFSSNPAYQVDSAYRHNLKALRDFRKSQPRQKEKLNKENVDSAAITKIRVVIDSLAFENAKQINSEKSYADFLIDYQLAKQREAAIELRDEVAFVDVLRQNSYQAFEDYMKRYPKSHRAADARQRYERLLFDTKTKDKKLESYVAFVRDFPMNPFKAVAEKNIFELSTVAGTPDVFLKFIEAYAKSSYVNLARNILFHIAHESEENISLAWMTDSLRKVVDIGKLGWFPVLRNGKFGFIDSRGVERLAPQFDAVLEEYKCAPITDNVLVTSNGLYSRGGTRLADRTSLVKDLGFGFVKVGDTSCLKVIHKSGTYPIDECLEDVSILSGRFIVTKKNGLTGLAALSGREILPRQWTSIEMMEGVVVLDHIGKKTLVLTADLERAANGIPLPGNFVFDNVKALGQGHLLVSNGSLEGIVDSELKFVVPLERQSLAMMPFGLVRKVSDGFVFTNLRGIDRASWKHYRFYRQWLLLDGDDGQKLFDTRAGKVVESKPDSLWVERGLVFASVRDSIHVHINSTTQISLGKSAKISFIKSADSIRYFFIEQKNKKTIFQIDTGEKLFTTDNDQVESFIKEIFLVSKKNKKGLVNRGGKSILPIEYDALVLQNQGQVSLLKDKKFGVLDLVTGKLIKPVFERNVVLLDPGTLVAFRDGHYGLIDWMMKQLTAFEFDEIRPWKQNTVWVKKGYEWNLYDVQQGKEMMRHIKSFVLISDRTEEKIAIVQQENYYGVLSNARGLVIPASFTLIRNLGAEDELLYFTAKEVEEAGIVVVIYYDGNGKLLRKQVYEDEEYLHILCPED